MKKSNEVYALDARSGLQIWKYARKQKVVNAYETNRFNRGVAVLGDPRLALAWIANELSRFSDGLQAGDVVTTGTCITPIPIAAGDRLRADFGAFGVVEATLT